MTKFTQKSFSVSCASGGISDEEMQKRWEATFGKKKKPEAQEEPEEDQEAEGGEAKAEGPDEDGPLGKRPAGKKA
jgi:hypothetical protein